MSDDELLKLARDLIVTSDPSGLADEPRWHLAKIKWLTVYLDRQRRPPNRPTWKFHGINGITP